MVTSTLWWPWMIPLVLGVFAAALVAGLFWGRRPGRADQVTWLANAGYVLSLSNFRRRVSRYRWFMIAASVLLLGSVIATSIVAARPVDQRTVYRNLAQRDIVLCLDVSLSMVPYDSAIVDKFLELLPGFNGERIALSVWNSTSRTVFPLTDDYTLVESELRTASRALSVDPALLEDGYINSAAEQRLVDFIQGTYLEDETSSSLVGDGLANCTYLLDEKQQDRSRSILLATDNQVLGEGIFSLPEAAALARDRAIELFGIYAGEETPDSVTQRDSYRQAMEEAGGDFYDASDPGLTQGIIDRISSQQATESDSPPELVVTDTPQRAASWAVVLLLLYLLGVWRLRS